VAEAVQLVASDPEAKILAGGHSLIPAMKLRLAKPGSLVDLSRIAELRSITVESDRVVIGAMATYNDLQYDDSLRQVLPVIAEMIRHVGDAQVRSRGTMGGALAHNDPAADSPAAVLALNAHMTAEGPSGERDIAADDFFVDLFTTALQPDEVLTRITIPLVGHQGSAYKKVEHPASGYAIVGIAAALTISDGSCSEARIALTGCTTKATRATAAESLLVGQPLNAATLQAAAEATPDGVAFTGDTYASEGYRRHLVQVVGLEVLSTAAERAQ
jgi:carbon-monoxide dehydrogenase medium subunit